MINVENDEFVVVDVQNPRKRKRNEAAWQKNRAKHGRYSEEGKLFNALSALLYFDVVEILFSDSCAGQNINFALLLALHMLAAKYQVKFKHYFPVRGHSYMPPDRAFGRVEKLLRCRETILMPC